MKKLLAKVRGKKQPEQPAGRITNDTLAEHREQVLAGGRKFKYPLQYQRHRLVINAAIISAAALVVLIGLGWYLLYQAQNTSEFMYRVTKVVPVPVAVVDGQQVRYSDYLMKYRSGVHYLTEKEQIDIKTEDGKRQLAFVKNQSMNDAVADAYAEGIARDLKIEVTDAELEAFLVQQRQASDGEVSEATYNSVIKDYYGWSPDEYRDAMKSKLLRQKVSYAVDDTALKLSEDIKAQITGGNANLKAIADELNSASASTVMYTQPAWVPKNNRDGGLAEAAGKLSKGQISEAIKTTAGDGYYFVKLVASEGNQLQYEYLFVPLKAFTENLQKIRDDGGLKELIKVESPAVEEQQEQQ